MFNKEKPVEAIVDRDKCIKCQQCVEICPADYLEFVDDRIKAVDNSYFGCLQCGHCMIKCPEECIEIKGEAISGEDLIVITDSLPGFDPVNTLFHKRRSIRKFKTREVSDEVMEKILTAASTAPMGVPPSEVKVLVINGAEKVQEFAEELVDMYDKTIKAMNPLVLNIAKPFIGLNSHKMFSEFVIPLGKLTVEARKQGRDVLFYNAPAVIIFYGTEITDKEDPVIASTYAQIAAETLGLGTCIIGSVAPLLTQNRALRDKYGILKGEKPATAFVLGYPEISFNKGIKRRFKAVNYR